MKMHNKFSSHLFNNIQHLVVLILIFSCCQSNQKPSAIDLPVSETILHESKERPDLLDKNSPANLRLLQITTDTSQSSWNVYTEARIFTPDSKRFVFVRENNYWLCDIEDNYGLRQITDEKDAIGPSVSPDGKWMYYFIDRTLSPEKTLTLKKLSLEKFTRETLLTIKETIPGTDYKISHIYTLSSISTDGKRLCTSCFLGDGKTQNAPWGLLVFNLEKPSVSLVFKGQNFNNMHPQYRISNDPELSHDILIQHNHDSIVDSTGKTLKLVGGDGADLHVIRDDGTNWRDIPIGRDGTEFCQGHQQWRGKMNSVLSSMSMPHGKSRILEGFPITTNDETSHKGFKIPGGKYNDITKNIENPSFWHFSADYSGMHLISDTYTSNDKTKEKVITIVIGTLSQGENPVLKMQYLLNTRTSGNGQSAHPHPFFSPDTKMAFLNSDVTGGPQVWMVTGYQFPEF